MRGKDARALDAHFEASRAGRGQGKWPRMDRGGKDARVPLGRLPTLAVRVDRSRSASTAKQEKNEHGPRHRPNTV
eukprot:7039075-Pyramimonas_sp.AAC.1